MTDVPTTSPPARQRTIPLPSERAQQWLIVLLLVAGAVSFLVKGADRPPDPYLKPAARQPVAGFGEIAYRVNRAAGVNRCALLAQTAPQQEMGLSGRQDLAGYDGMLFVYPADSTAPFTMRGVPAPLSIAWFDAGGRFLSSSDLEPCLDKPDCPQYNATAPYRYALQVPKGSLDKLGVGPGTVISVGGPCE